MIDRLNLSMRGLSLTNAFDAMHDNVQFLSWSELSYQDVTVHWSNPAVCKHICLIPYGNPVYVPGIHCWTQQRKADENQLRTRLVKVAKVKNECGVSAYPCGSDRAPGGPRSLCWMLGFCCRLSSAGAELCRFLNFPSQSLLPLKTQNKKVKIHFESSQSSDST